MKAMYEEMDRASWMCRLGAWVDENRIVAVGLVALAYVMAHDKSKR